MWEETPDKGKEAQEFGVAKYRLVLPLYASATGFRLKQVTVVLQIPNY